jgi:hypothetical protein
MKNHKYLTLLVYTFCLQLFAGTASYQSNYTLFQKPTLSQDKIVFAYAGDFWRVDRDGGQFKFQKIYNGESWNPNLQAPLAQPGLNIKVGEYLLSVIGRDLNGADNFYKYFESTAGKQVRLRVAPTPIILTLAI